MPKIIIGKEIKNSSAQVQSKYLKTRNVANRNNKNLKILIILFGPGGCGKTNTLRELIQDMSGVTLSSKPHDVRYIFPYGVDKCCIQTPGDCCEIVEDNCRVFEEFAPEICITACRSEGRCRETMKYFIEKHLQLQTKPAAVIWLNKKELNKTIENTTTPKPSKAVVNKRCSNLIKELIDKILLP
jgi:septin family protein